jgi:hypothetical protein
MKETQFIELLNLYVDHEIDAEEAKLLEAEVTVNPARRKVYRQYCSMQKACNILAEKYQEAVSEPDALPTRRAMRRWVGIVPASALALAACVAVLFAVRTHIVAPAPAGQVAAQESPARQADLTSIASDNYSRDLVPALSVRDFMLNTNARASDGLMAAASQNQDAPLAWISRLQVQSDQQVPAYQVNFNQNAAFLTPDNSQNSASSEQQEPAEMVAFRFQR